MVRKSEQRFIKINFITIIVTLLVILAGGVVRSTGSGMGCPDWPKCFNQYIPPTHVSQLPADYQDDYVHGRMKKNERFAKFLDQIGKQHLAERIRSDKSILEPEVFNPYKTWTEYVNRLVGVVTGIFVLLTAYFSFTYRKKAPRIFVLSVINIFVLVYQAWLGSIVVSTNLMQWVVTLHMLLALLILGISIYTYYYAKHLDKADTIIIYKTNWLKGFMAATFVLSIVQVVLGTEVREQIDVISKALNFSNRADWVMKVGEYFNYHRDLAILVFVCNIVVYKMIKDRFSGKEEQLSLINWVWLALLIQLISGVVLAYVALPPLGQVVHLVCATVLFSLQFYLYLLVINTHTYKQ